MLQAEGPPTAALTLCDDNNQSMPGSMKNTVVQERDVCEPAGTAPMTADQNTADAEPPSCIRQSHDQDKKRPRDDHASPGLFCLQPPTALQKSKLTALQFIHPTSIVTPCAC